MGSRREMKQRVAHTVKWCAIDRSVNVVLNIVTGIALANILPREDFGLVAAGACLSGLCSNICGRRICNGTNSEKTHIPQRVQLCNVV